MNKVIEAGNTLGAAVKIGGAALVVYGVYRGYRFSQDLTKQADDVASQISDITNDTTEFFTETLNPVSSENLIKQSIVGETLTPVFNGLFDFLGVGKK